MLQIPALALYGDEPEINSECVLLYETRSGTVVYAKNADQQAYPASTTKIMTALLALKYCGLEEIVTYTKDGRQGLDKDSSIAGLMVGEYMTMYNMLKCLLVASGNDAANAIAIHVGGSISRFVEMMNEEAEELGCTGTHFANPHGLHDSEHYTTAEDMLKITLAAREYDVFREIVSQGQATVPPTNKYEKERVFNNTNMLLSGTTEGLYLYSKATGIKTGHTSQAGYCLVSSANNDDLDFVCIAFGGYTYFSSAIDYYYITSYQDTLRLFRWGFAGFKWHSLFSTSSMITEVKVEQGADKDHVLLSPIEDVGVLIHKDQDPDELFTYIISTEPTLTAPVEKGSVHGTITIMRGNEVYRRVDLAAATGITASPIMHRLDSLRAIFTSSSFIAILVTLILAVVLYCIFLIYYNTKRNKHRRKSRRRRNSQ